MQPALPLKNLRIVEALSPDAPIALCQAASIAGRVASDLGASVTQLRSRTPNEAENAFLNGGKTCLTVAREEWTDLNKDLCTSADVLFCDGLAEDLEPHQIAVRLRMSRAAPQSGTEFTVEAQAGLLNMVGDPDREPLRLGGHQTAYATGMAAYLAMASALPAAPSASSAQTLTVDMLDVAIWLNWKSVATAHETGEVLTRAGPNGEWTNLRCRDGYFALVYRPQDWDTLTRVFDDPRLKDTRFKSVSGRRAHMAEVNSLIEELFATQSRRLIHGLSLLHRLPLGPVWTPDDLANEAHMLNRAFFANSAAGPMPTLPAKWNGHTFGPATNTERERHETPA